MAQKIKKYLSFLEYLNNCSTEEQQEQLATLKGDALKFIFNLLLNVVYKNIAISPETKVRLKSHQQLIEKLIAKKKSLKQRKAELLESNQLSTLLNILLPDLRQAIL